MSSPLIDGDPQRLGGYWLAGRLGEGGQGVVYEGYDQDGTRVAVKVLRGDPAGAPRLRERLAKEAAAAQRVAPFCTARVLDADLDGPRPYIVSAYVEGPSLRDAGRTFGGDDLHRLATAIATALTAVHDAGVVHRDLKPGNVLLGPDGPRVIDFGVARTREMTLSSTGDVTGTPGYLAPEIISGERAGPAADVFAWGAVVLYAATGEDPFTGDSLGTIMHRVLTHDPDLSVLPASLRRPVESALAKDAALRPTARDLLLSLLTGTDPTPHLLVRTTTGTPDTAGHRTQAVAAGGRDTRDTTRIGRRTSGTAGAGRRARDGAGTAAATGRVRGAGTEAIDTAQLLALGAGGGGRVGAAFAAKADPALGAIAEDAYAALPPEDRLLVPELFLRLVTVTDEGELALREPRRSELPAGMERVLRAFTYLVSGGDPVRLLRPALPLAWPRLREWIEADRDGLAVHRRITVATGRWQEHGRKDADLFHGSTLDDALRWVAADRTHLTLTPAERDFLASSATLTRRRSRHTRLLTVGLAALLALALGAGGLAWRQSATLAGQRDAADSARLAAASHAARGRDPVLGMLLAAASGKLSPTAAARSSLLAAAADPAAGSFRDPATGPDAVRTLTGDGRSLVSVTPGGATIWDIATGHRTAGFTGPVTGSVTGPVAGPVTAPATTGGTDRGGAAGAGNPAAAGSTVKARNTAGAGAGRTARTSTAATRPTSPDSGAGTGEGRLREVAVSRDGKVLAVVDDTGVGLWEVGSGQPLGQRIPAPADADVSLAFGEGRLLVTVGQTTQVHDWRTGKTTPLPGLRRPAVHPRGRYAVSGPDLYLLPSGKRRPGFPGVCADCDSAAAFSPDGARLAISDDDGLTVYDTRTREELAVLHGWEDHAVPVFSQDGELVAGIGAKITVWRPGADEPLLLERRPRDPVTAAAFGPDGLRYLSDDTVVTLVPAPPSDEPMDTVRLSGDGRTVAMHALGSTAITLNGRRRETGAFDDYDSELAFSPDNRLLAVRRGDHVTVRDVASWRELAALTPRFAAESESKTVLPTSKGLWTAGERTFTLWGLPGGRRLKQVPRPERLLGWTATADGRLVGLDTVRRRLVDLETDTPFGARLPLPARADGVWFGTGLDLVAVNFAGKVGVWDTATGAQMGGWMRVEGAPWDAALSPDGRLFAYASQDNTLSLWDVRQGRRIGPPVGLTGSARSVAFTAGSAEVLAVGRGGRLTRLPTTVEALTETVCIRAGRTLTAAEWHRHLPERAYEPVCPLPAR
ncbi:serine/threonine-protein kinase [Nonomuraea sp. NPDC049504]|uniref:WD40 repeat domain-containing serine/threonine protein kinase n=1 Tax=Nonomuraea sp. NPDC049504 TaxID=3154729 RepID=UPI00343F6803